MPALLPCPSDPALLLHQHPPFTSIATHAASQSDVIPEKELRRLLSEVDLEYLVEREGGLDAVVDWGAQLSLGEQQRLGMARLFYHRPKFAILDECTSGVTVSCPLTTCAMMCPVLAICVDRVLRTQWHLHCAAVQV